MTSPNKSCAIFCRVIDNFGDVGVCWRLGRQLADEYPWQVTLYLDQPEILSKLLLPDDFTLVTVKHWNLASENPEVADVVIEAFACDLPAPYVAAMAKKARSPVWINLEYLTAEAWVDDCHKLGSPHPASHLIKHFFFPGFSPKSGGVLREHDYFARQIRFDPIEFCHEWSIPFQSNELRLSYFAYPNAPWNYLLVALAASEQPVRLIVPGGTVRDEVIGNLHLQSIPFLPQRRYDELLWLCDFNFVRGEDSFVRAQLAARPFMWSIYQQNDWAHEAKLKAFLDRYLATCDAADIRSAWLAWNAGQMFDWPSVAADLQAIEKHAQRWRDRWLHEADLARQLVQFCDGLFDRIE